MSRYKYRIVRKPSNNSFTVQYKPAGLFSMIVDCWTSLTTFITVGEAQKFCLDCLDKDKIVCEKNIIIQTYNPRN